jgi:hypothetical protein
MTIEMDPAFAAALRDVLVRRAASAAPARRSRRRLWTGAVLGVALVGGAGVAAAELRALPGGEVVEPLGESITVNGVGPLDIDLGPVPEGATAVTFELTCRSAGFFTHPGGTSSSCAGSDVGGRPSVTSGEVPLAVLDGTVFALGASPQARWTLTLTYVHAERTPVGVNARGETYGVAGDGSEPDLISAIATNGREGYVRRSELDAAAGANASTPAEALAWQDAHAGETFHIPVYESDGETVIGSFQVGP